MSTLTKGCFCSQNDESKPELNRKQPRAECLGLFLFDAVTSESAHEKTTLTSD